MYEDLHVSFQFMVKVVVVVETFQGAATVVRTDE